MNNKKSRYMVIIVLLVSVVALSLGYATFTKTLTISDISATTAISFDVAFSKAATSASPGALTATLSPTTGGPTAGSATVAATTVSGIKANFTAPNQTVTYTFYARNIGQVPAYLNTVNIGSKTCSAGGANPASTANINAACSGISVSVKVGSATAYNETTTGISSHKLDKGGNEKVVVTISYADGAALADGTFNVAIGDITLLYGSVD